MFIVGVSGGSGSGKTSFLRALKSRFSKSQLAVLSQDDYYLPVDRNDENHKINFDIPKAVDLQALLADIVSLKNGTKVLKKEYTFNNSATDAQTIEILPADILIVEGLFVFHHEEIKRLFNQMVYIEAAPELRLKRRLHRDKTERGYSEEDILYKWHEQVEPGFKNYLEPYRQEADYIVNSDISIDKGVNKTSALFENMLAHQ